MMLVNENDELRRDFGIRSRDAKRILKCRQQLCIPMPALGEVFCKIRDKCKDNSNEVLLTLNKLMDDGYFRTRYISNPYDTFELSKRLSNRRRDSRDLISAMDALILATAIVDPDCTEFYTSDTKLVSDSNVSEIVADYRENNDYDRMAEIPIDKIIA